ncbi:hypothetical protein [Niastella caeni]|nr:hypothetical protein [Niastella caeni]
MSLFLRLFKVPPAGYFYSLRTRAIVIEKTNQLVVKDNRFQGVFR